MTRARITGAGRKKLCMAHAGDIRLPAITQMALGSGGLDEEGNVIFTTGNEVALYNELLRRNIDEHEYMDENRTSCRYLMKVEEGELVGEKITEVGLYDEEGDLVVYKSFPGLEKDEYTAFIFNIDEIFMNV